MTKLVIKALNFDKEELENIDKSHYHWSVRIERTLEKCGYKLLNSRMRTTKRYRIYECIDINGVIISVYTNHKNETIKIIEREA